MHSGSPVSLYPADTLHLMNGPRGPSRLQKLIYDQWAEILLATLEMRQSADRLIVINMGDGVEGLHHQSKEIISSYLTDHQKIHETLMHECKAITQYDTLYYVNGTPSHAGENEYDLATILGAEKYSEGNFTHPILRKRLHGHMIYAAHHGATAGDGYHAGNALRNKIKQLDYECLVNGEPSPEMAVFADKHTKQKETVNIYGREIQGYILPSLKLKDGFVYKVKPFAFSNIGAMVTTVTENEMISKFLTIHIEQDVIGEM